MDEVFVPSTWARLTARCIDQLISLVLYIPFAKTMFLLFLTDEDVIVSLAQVILFFLIPTFYEIFFLALMQRTPGKWFMGLKVVPAMDPHQNLTWAQCLLRPLVSLLSFFFGLAIYAVAFFRYDRTHIADWVAETRVVQNTARSARTKLRWVAGVFFILIYSGESLSSAAQILNQIDWKNGELNLRKVVDPQEFMPDDMEMDI